MSLKLLALAGCFVLVVILLALYFFLFSVQTMAFAPRIIFVEEEDVCILFNRTTAQKDISISYKNLDFSVEICKFSSKEETEKNFNYVLEIFSFLQYNKFGEKILDSFKGFLYGEGNKAAFVSMKNEILLFCRGHSDYALNVCEWFIKNKLGEYT